jgi:RHH-type proline utilization regulon transcriptional repressor/proline dehydrogenase/delta 1-pyrroline-5-carboxylate dehydrogenase
MLEGMAPAQSRTVRAAAGEVLLYAPVVRPDDLAASIAYLTRRLDENTSPDNFLRALFTLQPGSADWHHQQARFEAAMSAVGSVVATSRRTQDRSVATAVGDVNRFDNCADTDWTQSANRSWIAAELAACEVPVYPVIDTVEHIDSVVATAVAAAAQWGASSFAERRSVLAAVADEMERGRGRTLALMARTACKTIAEGDPEVSEAIDFARYYGWCTLELPLRDPGGWCVCRARGWQRCNPQAGTGSA